MEWANLVGPVCAQPSQGPLAFLRGEFALWRWHRRENTSPLTRAPAYKTVLLPPLAKGSFQIRANKRPEVRRMDLTNVLEDLLRRCIDGQALVMVQPVTQTAPRPEPLTKGGWSAPEAPAHYRARRIDASLASTAA
jgi:hypothetical protein